VVRLAHARTASARAVERARVVLAAREGAGEGDGRGDGGAAARARTTVSLWLLWWHRFAAGAVAG
jgi:hypothetical protein